MNRQYVIDHNLVERYLRGELEGEEAVQFEQFYLSDPETLDEIEASLLMGEHADLLTLPPIRQESSRTVSFWSWLLPVTGAFAGALVAVLLATQYFGGEDQAGSLNKPLRAAVVYDMVQRRSDQAEPVRIAAADGAAVLRFFVPPGMQGRFDLELVSRQSTQSLKDLSPDANGIIAVWIDQEDSLGQWQLKLTGPQGYQAEYALQISSLSGS